ncbi:quinolinate synthase [Candidatus Marinamargulisbacteria bacterium SCGC AG-343-D04]|nr:quinolinate synthase [Candidatus Marinamargulisbacteria bacterium SCGC AG-343-D04]
MKWTAELLFNHLKDVTLGGSICVYTLDICETLVPKINAIMKLKKEKNAIVLAHSYVVPEIIKTVSDFTGDSYELSKKAKDSSADIIIFSAVKFMAETAKLINPNKDVYIPSDLNGCSLADSITGDDVKQLRKKYPDYTFVCYINTTVDVKAECDVCVTSSNVYSIVESLPNKNIYFLPDKLMGQNLKNELKKRGSDKNILFSEGTCYVHEEYHPDMIDFIRLKHDDVSILAHPECSEDIISKVDFTGSTSQMVNYVNQSPKSKFFMLTECGLTSRMQADSPKKSFVGTCTMCKYMKSNSLDDILNTLENLPEHKKISIPKSTQEKALNCINKMFELA